MSSAALLTAQAELSGFGPTIDGVELMQAPWKLAERGHVANATVLAGSVSEDATYGDLPQEKVHTCLCPAGDDFGCGHRGSFLNGFTLLA